MSVILYYICIDNTVRLCDSYSDILLHSRDIIQLKNGQSMNVYKVGLDIGSTTAKLVMLDSTDKMVFSLYERHHANISDVLTLFFRKIKEQFGNCMIMPTITGSVGMGLAEKFSIPFVQEVIATTELVKKEYPYISTIIDIGGEDAKIVYLTSEGVTDLRMNGNCAGGTGAFIDQMAILLGVAVNELDSLAAQAKSIYPIASRCGVFSKTDVQNLISKNISKADIAASIFHAVSVQTVVTLSHGCTVNPKILFCGGPLTFIPSLRKAFMRYLEMEPDDFITPDNANIIPAWGASLCSKGESNILLSQFVDLIENKSIKGDLKQTVRLSPIFESDSEYETWKERKSGNNIKQVQLTKNTGDVYLGIDSGSTTTKIVIIDEEDNILFSHYVSNAGNPVQTVKTGLEQLLKECEEQGINLMIKGGYSTGYGEDLIKSAFNLNGGIIETIAHYVAARKINPNVTFILDIGGQDMKAMFVENGVLSRMEINEACSSGCGSFIETFAKSLNYTVESFSEIACKAKEPCDLGTRCTVFMNSKVKQVLREGATIADIAAGLSYSVIKNCLYKVLRLKNADELGKEIVVQGGTMRNNSVVRAFEQLVGVEVFRSNMPELMGAYGSALYAKSILGDNKPLPLQTFLETAGFKTRQITCRGCENQCLVNRYTFFNDNVYFSGNKCEKVFSNNGVEAVRGRNLSIDKYNLLFERKVETGNSKLKIGIPRCLGMYENYPFWHALFTECGMQVYLSEPSTFKKYEAGVHTVMSDNICFPAKLVHSHIYDLAEKQVDRIFFPYSVFEKKDNKKAANSYNCPIITGYSDVLKSAVELDIPIDSPIITFKDKSLLKKSCTKYLQTLGINDSLISNAIKKAICAQHKYESDITALNQEAYQESFAVGRLTILLAGRPYHTDPLVQHKISDMIADMGVDVVTEDIVRMDDALDFANTHMVTQWSYINRILRSARWVAEQGNNIHFVQMTSFGCGPDAFLLDEIKEILNRHGKSLTLLKIDDVNNIGSIKLRVRSVIESLKFNHEKINAFSPFVTTKKYLNEDRRRKIIAPFFTDYISPLIPSIFKLAGYEVINLPGSSLDSIEYGLQYANNEVCYPATLVIGDIINALKSGKYKRDEIAVVMTQTGGQCRASNYLSLIKKAMVEAGYGDIPVLSISFGSGLKNDQPGFKMNWLKILPMVLAMVLYGDCISKFYHASVVREKERGEALRLRNHYMSIVQQYIIKNDVKGVWNTLSCAAKDFDNIIIPNDTLPKVGLVGEIFLKFNSFANKDVTEWLIERKIEVIPPILSPFFLQSFVNQKVNRESYLEKSNIPSFVMDSLYKVVFKQIEKVNRIGSEFRYFTPFSDIFKEADHTKGIISLAAQFGEGWLLPSEIVSFVKQGVNNVISLQPFGCIANHIVSKGIEKKIRTLYPQVNLLSLDFDSGVSDVNIANRLLLFTNSLK